jgi:predicted regulator of Ras-like GTPase activity (Roadblock/LC7/MglB family)
VIDRYIEQAVDEIPQLIGIFVTAMPDSLLFSSWVRPGTEWSAEDVAAYFGDLIRSNRQGLKALGSWSSEMQVTIESAESLVVLRELSADFVCGCVFERTAPLGMVRLHLKRLLERITHALPKVEAEERPRGTRIMEFLDRYAPDPHAVMLRVSLRAGISLDELRTPAVLNADQIRRLEETACKILGVNQLSL